MPASSSSPRAPVQTRQTIQRTALLELFHRCPRPLSPQELLGLARQGGQRVGIATVYRTINLFLEAGQICAVELAGAGRRYELTGKEHHHHFLCRSCSRTFDIRCCLENVASAAPEGCQVEGHDLLLRGLCAKCSKKR